MRIKLMVLILIYSSILGCSSEQKGMNETEKFLAEKYDAERISLDFKTLRTETNAKLTEDRKFISVMIVNPKDIDKLISDNKYSDERGKKIANFVIDSIQFDEMPFQPKEIQLEFLNNSGFFIFNSENKKTITYNLN